MAKRKRANLIQGRWLIEQMDQWDVADDSTEIEPFIEFDNGGGGQFQFTCVCGQMDHRATEREGQSAIEFTWEGNDESEQVFGRGWAVLGGDELTGKIFFHMGDESGFSAKRVAGKANRKQR